LVDDFARKLFLTVDCGWKIYRRKHNPLWPQQAGTSLLKKQGCQAEYDRRTALPFSSGRKILRRARRYLVGTIPQLELAIKLDVRRGG
jgi:hypothetical protein